ncbi:hypothetical protein GCM10007049_37130 [Echinicola pacifica]|uniref:Uncharacterized protein n=1 Tax=Echinicola pacifica TaxID=346377 RepID=A0A918QBQ3_9BACT|nr:hypothetical protein GCM10007049_37130 [Echinicola pacifica]
MEGTEYLWIFLPPGLSRIFPFLIRNINKGVTITPIKKAVSIENNNNIKVYNYMRQTIALIYPISFLG